MMLSGVPAFLSPRVRRGQFGNTMVDIIVWLIVIGVAVYFIIHYITANGVGVVGSVDPIAGGIAP